MNSESRNATAVKSAAMVRLDHNDTDMKRARRPDAALGRRLFINAALLALAFFADPPLAKAHDIYSGLSSNYGTACCDDSDCRPAPYRLMAAGVQMQIDQKWISVPSSAIQYRLLLGDSGKTAGGHWCGRRANDVEELNDGSGNGYFTFCAILPPNFVAALVNDVR